LGCGPTFTVSQTGRPTIGRKPEYVMSTMILDRTSNAAMFGGTTAAAFTGIQPGFCMIPRCEMRVEKCQNGMKIICRCDDEAACGVLQNLCKMLAGGLCTCGCTLNGITICQYNFACGNCKCEYTDEGITITCTSGDKTCCQTIQACCQCLSACIDAGCCCYLSFNNTPVCCGSCNG
jgi:hypothetical protein